MEPFDHDPLVDAPPPPGPPGPPATWAPPAGPSTPSAGQQYAPPTGQTVGQQPYGPPVGQQPYGPPVGRPGAPFQGWAPQSGTGWAPQPGQGWAGAQGGAAPNGYPQNGYAPAPGAAASASGAGPREALHWIVPVGRSWQSIVAGYLGIFSLAIWFLAPFSVGVGIWALVRANHGGHGRGRAITGIVGGLIGAALGIAALAGALS